MKTVPFFCVLVQVLASEISQVVISAESAVRIQLLYNNTIISHAKSGNTVHFKYICISFSELAVPDGEVDPEEEAPEEVMEGMCFDESISSSMFSDHVS